MIDKFLGLTTGFSITDVGILAALVTIIVEVLKSIVPKEFPTQILATITSLIASVFMTISFCGLSLTSVTIGMILGFIVAFVSMKGFDSLKEILTRFTLYNYDKLKDDKSNQKDSDKNVRK